MRLAALNRAPARGGAAGRLGQAQRARLTDLGTFPGAPGRAPPDCGRGAPSLTGWGSGGLPGGLRSQPQVKSLGAIGLKAGRSTTEWTNHRETNAEMVMDTARQIALEG